MARKKASGNLGAKLKAIAMTLPGVEEGVACKGTALESTTFKARGRAFLFVGRENFRLKLDSSLGDIHKLAAIKPKSFDAGKLGWTRVALDDAQSLPEKQIIGWVVESYRALAPKKLLAEIDSKESGQETKSGQEKKSGPAKKSSPAS